MVACHAAAAINTACQPRGFKPVLITLRHHSVLVGRPGEVRCSAPPAANQRTEPQDTRGTRTQRCDANVVLLSQGEARNVELVRLVYLQGIGALTQEAAFGMDIQHFNYKVCSMNFSQRGQRTKHKPQFHRFVELLTSVVGASNASLK